MVDPSHMGGLLCRRHPRFLVHHGRDSHRAGGLGHPELLYCRSKQDACIQALQ